MTDANQSDAVVVPDEGFKHCDDYIDDETQPECLRTFLDYARAPAHGALRDTPKPALFADHRGRRVRVTMASRFGDVGITGNLRAEYGYSERVAVCELSGFSDQPTPGEKP
jgi:hypothetical protein